MSKYDKIKKDFDNQSAIESQQYNVAESGMKEIADDSRRTAEIYKNAEAILNDIDDKFMAATKLDKVDIAFLFFATALQCVRQYFITNRKERLSDQEYAKNTKGHNEEHSYRKRGEWFLPTSAEIIVNPVPYDATRQTELVKKQNALKGAGKLGHRLTLGHDPILGWIFGTANIATSTLTSWDMQSYHIKSKAYKTGSASKVDYLSSPVSTKEMMGVAIERFFKNGTEGYSILATSLMKEWIHLKSDIGTKNSLPLPVVSTISPELANVFADYGLDVGNIVSFSKQAIYAEAINIIIGILHGMYCYYLHNNGDSKQALNDISFINHSKDSLNILELNKIKTRKILSWSNLIASTSNVIAVGIIETIGFKSGNEKLMKKGWEYLDIGGLAVTVYRLVSDTKFINEVKREFLEKEWYNTVVGEDYQFIAEAKEMSKKDIMKGIEIQAKADAAKTEKLANGLAKHAEVLTDIKSKQETVRQNVDVVLQDKRNQEAETLYGLKSKRKISDLDYTEQRVLSATIYTLMANNENSSDLQRRFYQCIEQYGVSERIDNFDFSKLKNIDSYSDRKIILKAICAFLFLKDCTFEFKDNMDNFKWLIDFTSQKDVEEICEEISKEFSILGEEGLITGYLPPIALITISAEEECETRELSLCANGGVCDYSKLTQIIERFISDEKSFGKRVKTDEAFLKRELGKSYPNISPSATIAATKIANGYLIFTTYAVYLKLGNIFHNKYACLPYQDIITEDISTGEGRLKGTRKLIVPYLNGCDERLSVELDDVKVEEEKVRDLLNEIKTSDCSYANTDKNINFADLNKDTLKTFLSILYGVLNKGQHSLTEVYMLNKEYNAFEEWSDIDKVSCSDCVENAIDNFLNQIPYPSQLSISLKAMNLFMRTITRSNILEGKEATLLSHDEEQYIKHFDFAGEISSTDFNIMLKLCSKDIRQSTVEDLGALKKGIIHADIIYSEKVLSGIDIMIDNLKLQEIAKQNTLTAKLKKVTQDKIVPEAKNLTQKAGEHFGKIKGKK